MECVDEWISTKEFCAQTLCLKSSSERNIKMISWNFSPHPHFPWVHLALN